MDGGRTVIVVNNGQLSHLVLLLTALPLLLFLVRLFALLFPHVLLGHVEVGCAYGRWLPQRLKLIKFSPHLYGYACVVRSEVEPVFGEYEGAELALVVLKQKLLGIRFISE